MTSIEVRRSAKGALRDALVARYGSLERAGVTGIGLTADGVLLLLADEQCRERVLADAAPLLSGLGVPLTTDVPGTVSAT